MEPLLDKFGWALRKREQTQFTEWCYQRPCMLHMDLTHAQWALISVSLDKVPFFLQCLLICQSYLFTREVDSCLAANFEIFIWRMQILRTWSNWGTAHPQRLKRKPWGSSKVTDPQMNKKPQKILFHNSFKTYYVALTSLSWKITNRKIKEVKS